MGFEREIDDVRHPQARVEEGGGDGAARIARHAERGGIDDAVGLIHGRCQIGADDGAVCAVNGVERGAQRLRAACVRIEQYELSGAKAHQRMGGGGPCPAGPHLHHMIERSAGQAGAHIFCKAENIAIMADKATIAKDDGVDCADLRRLFGQVVKMGDNRLLIGVRHIDARKSAKLHSVQHPAQIVRVQSFCGEIEQAIDQRLALRGRFLFMQPGRQRTLNVPADQARQIMIIVVGQGRKIPLEENPLPA